MARGFSLCATPMPHGSFLSTDGQQAPRRKSEGGAGREVILMGEFRGKEILL